MAVSLCSTLWGIGLCFSIGGQVLSWSQNFPLPSPQTNETTWSIPSFGEKDTSIPVLMFFIEKEIHTIITSFWWYQDILHSQEWKYGDDYIVNIAVADYLESYGFYKATGWILCSKTFQTEEKHCYIGTSEQNRDLLLALRRKDVQKELSQLRAVLTEDKHGMYSTQLVKK